MASELKLSEPYHPIDSETGAELPITRTFTVDGRGYGTVQIYTGEIVRPQVLEDMAESDMIIMPSYLRSAVRLVFIEPNGPDIHKEHIWVDSDEESLHIINSDELIAAEIRNRLGL